MTKIGKPKHPMPLSNRYILKQQVKTKVYKRKVINITCKFNTTILKFGRYFCLVQWQCNNNRWFVSTKSPIVLLSIKKDGLANHWTVEHNYDYDMSFQGHPTDRFGEGISVRKTCTRLKFSVREMSSLKALQIAWNSILKHLGENSRWVPLSFGRL